MRADAVGALVGASGPGLARRGRQDSAQRSRDLVSRTKERVLIAQSLRARVKAPVAWAAAMGAAQLRLAGAWLSRYRVHGIWTMTLNRCMAE